MVVAKKTKKGESGFDWQETISGLGVSFFKNFADNLADKIKHRIQEIVIAFQRGMIGTFLLIIGIVFVLVGLASLINEILAVGDGVGYSVVGIISIFIGLVIIKSK